MGSYLIRRLLLAVGVLAAVSLGTFVFFSTRFGSPWTGQSEHLAASPADAVSLWWAWVRGLPHGGHLDDPLGLGTVGAQTWQSLGHTAILVGGAGLLVVVFGVLVGVVAAARPGSGLDVLLRGLSYLAWAVPAFVVALVLQSVFNWAGSRFGFRPFALAGWPGQCLVIGGTAVQGCGPHSTGGSVSALAYLRHLTLPAIALALAFVGLHARYLRSSLLVALNAPYTTTARAKGLPERSVVLRHALRNSLATFLSALLLDMGAIFGAAMAVDWIFQLNGLGTLFLIEIESGAINTYAVVLLLSVSAAVVVAASFLSELAIAALDPRARLR